MKPFYALAAFLMLSLAVAWSPTAKAQTPPKPFTLRSGEYSLHFATSGENADALSIRRQGKPLALVTQLAGGKLFRATDSQFLRGVTTSQSGGTTRVSFRSERDWATLRGTVETYAKTPGLFRLRLDVTTKRATNITDATPELQLMNGGKTDTNYTLWKQQAAIEAPVVYFASAPLDSSVLYFQNLSSLNGYMELVQGDPRATVKLDASGLGFHRPRGWVPGGASFTISDAFVWLSPGVAQDEFGRARNFVEAISAIYDHLPKPPTEYTDWPFFIAPKAAKDLLDPINHIAGDSKLLTSYVARPQTQAESICNWDVLISAKNYRRTFGGDENLRQLIRNIESGMPRWISPLASTRERTITNVFEVQPVIDSWYYVYPIAQAAVLARDGDETAKKMVLESAPRLMKVTRAMDYEYPFVVDIENLKRVNDSFREFDVLGGYAVVMLACYDWTRDETYLQEAKNAVEHIRGKEWKFTYEAMLTGQVLDALAELYTLTGDKKYVDLSWVPLANLMVLTWFWEPDYGYAKSYQMFLGVNPLPGANQIAPIELHNVWASLHRFYARTEKALPPSTRTLLAETLKYQMTVARYHIPFYLPEESLATASDWGVLRRDMAIPIEDLQDGFQKSAMVGQEVYGAGQMFRFAADAYRVFGAKREVVLFSEYPIFDATWTQFARRLKFRLGGTAKYQSRVRVFFRGALSEWRDRAVLRAVGANGKLGRAIEMSRIGDSLECFLSGGGIYEIGVAPRVLAKAKNASVAAPKSSSQVRVLAKPQNAANGKAASTRGAKAKSETNVVFRIAGIIGSSGVVLVQPRGVLAMPIVVTNGSAKAAKVSFEATLPAGWTMGKIAFALPRGASRRQVVQLRVPDLQSGAQQEITLWLREGTVRTRVLACVVRAANVDAPFDETFDGATILRNNDRRGEIAIANGAATLKLLADSYTEFETRDLTIDLDKHPYLDLDFGASDATWSVKIYPAGKASFGTYIVPANGPPPSGTTRVHLQGRTGWTGVHSFRLSVLAVGKAGSALHLNGWRFAPAEKK